MADILVPSIAIGGVIYLVYLNWKKQFDIQGIIEAKIQEVEHDVVSITKNFDNITDPKQAAKLKQEYLLAKQSAQDTLVSAETGDLASAKSGSIETAKHIQAVDRGVAETSTNFVADIVGATFGDQNKGDKRKRVCIVPVPFTKNCLIWGYR